MCERSYRFGLVIIYHINQFKKTNLAYMCMDAQNNLLIEMVFFSTHSICLHMFSVMDPEVGSVGLSQKYFFFM